MRVYALRDYLSQPRDVDRGEPTMQSMALSSGGVFLFGQEGDTSFTGTTNNDVLIVATHQQSMTFAPGDGADLIIGFISGVDHLVLDGGQRTTTITDTPWGEVVYHNHLGPGPDQVLLFSVHNLAPSDLVFTT